MQLTPDVQVYVNPALAPNTSVAAVFSLRATFKNYCRPRGYTRACGDLPRRAPTSGALQRERSWSDLCW